MPTTLRCGSLKLTLCALATVALLSAGNAAQANDEGRGAKLDHFLCYSLGGLPDFSTTEVFVEDQFIAASMLAFQFPSLFCNPTQKTHDERVTRIRNIDHHLALHGIEGSELQPAREIIVSNQFGAEQTWRIQGGMALFVPTTKEPHPAPKGLDHFLCYQAVPTGQRFTSVTLEDQFGFYPSSVNTLFPTLFCNPAAKTHNEVTTRIQNRRDHLMCYIVFVTRLREFSNQLTVGLPPTVTPRLFNPGTLPFSLCVPSAKLSVDGVPVR
jgi:hypothetical protein